MPPLAVRAEAERTVGGRAVIAVRIPKADCLTAVDDGRVLRRRLLADGTAATVPCHPVEWFTGPVWLRRLDFSRSIPPGAGLEDLDPAERLRVRRLIVRLQGEAGLADLADEDFDRALGFTTTDGSGRTVPTFCGLLLIGRAERLKAMLPTAGACLEVVMGTRVRRRVELDIPVAAALETLLKQLREAGPLVLGRSGSFPDGFESAFCEGLANAFAHRDYARFGRVRVVVSAQRVLISNPGGFADGISPGNLLTAPPAGRNALLSDALKRIGLAARVGRGGGARSAAPSGGRRLAHLPEAGVGAASGGTNAHRASRPFPPPFRRESPA